MKRILKIMAMLLVVSAVVFAAGCSDKADTNKTDQGASEEVNNQAPVADENMTQSEEGANALADANISDNNTTSEALVVTNNASENVTGNATQSGTHMSNTQRKMAIAQSHQQSTGTQKVSQ